MEKAFLLFAVDECATFCFRVQQTLNFFESNVFRSKLVRGWAGSKQAKNPRLAPIDLHEVVDCIRAREKNIKAQLDTVDGRILPMVWLQGSVTSVLRLDQVIKDTVWPAVGGVARRRGYWCPQNGASSHVTQNCLVFFWRKFFRRRVRPVTRAPLASSLSRFLSSRFLVVLSSCGSPVEVQTPHTRTVKLARWKCCSKKGRKCCEETGSTRKKKIRSMGILSWGQYKAKFFTLNILYFFHEQIVQV